MTSTPTRADLVSLLAGEVDAPTLAERHGVTEAEILRLRAAFLDGMKVAAEPVVPRRMRTRLAVAGVAVLATAAFAQLTTFVADTPAQAAQVNANFTQLRTWIEQKVGVVGTSAVSATGNVTAASFTTVGNVAAGSYTTTGNLLMGATTRQMLNLYGIDYGIGVQGSTQYYRSGGNHAWYRGGIHHDATFNPGAGLTQMTLTDSLLTVNGAMQINGTGGNVPNNCVTRQGPGNSYQASCSAGEIAVGGGGRCNTLYRLTESLPWGGPSDVDEPVNGQPARAWRAVCQIWGNASTYVYPQLGVFAICCRK